MLNEEEALPRITTSCSDLDKILGGGISCRDVTEIGKPPISFTEIGKQQVIVLIFCLFSAGGVPGIGKTQIGIQLSVNVQIPREFGGLGGKAIYIGMLL